MPNPQRIIIVGAGLCGSLLAIRLAQRGHQVAVYEQRSDPRQADAAGGRSINLALSARGLMALERVGIKDQILEHCIPMRGRMIHPLEGESFFSSYSARPESYINSVSRSGLNATLLDQADQLNNVSLHFDHKVTKVDLKKATIYFKDDTGQAEEASADLVIGTDGAGSVVRKALMGQTTKLLFNYSQSFLRYGYKELTIHPGSDGAFRIRKEALHIWPRGKFMIIALPNPDGSFTLTMFHPFDGPIGFDALDSKEKVKAFFEEYFPSLLPYIPDYLEEYFENPIGTLGTIRCSPWQAYGKTLIMGDAAHAIVPFYGQGMNASFEDVRVFDDLLEAHGQDWPLILRKFQEDRVENANAIADLAIDNFYEMIDKVGDEKFIRKRKIELQLEQQYSDYYSKYSLVTFRPELDYKAARKLGRKQDEILLEMVGREGYEKIELDEYYEAVKRLQ
ncbi:kynurenine 3-monooxygenase [Lewinellaceae bacterium SD302]|nr:kynurenine 3-monooxygenase [Lewinellaceae bacterium SD302]